VTRALASACRALRDFLTGFVGLPPEPARTDPSAARAAIEHRCATRGRCC
jgi:hypothetical protein